MSVYGEADPPRIVACGFGPKHSFAKVLEQYAGAVHYYKGEDEIRWESWDAVVALGWAPITDGHLRVLQVGGEPIGEKVVSGRYGGERRPFLLIQPMPGDELVVPSTLRDPLKELVRRELLPLVIKAHDGHAYRQRIRPPECEPSDTMWYLPLLHDYDQFAIAANYRPQRGPAECIYLPELLTDLRPWLIAAFKLWSEDEPDIFPSEPEWTNNPTWMTNSEMSAFEALKTACEDAQRVIDAANAAVAVAESAFNDAKEAANSTERQLLTGTDDQLADEVAATLKELGFAVTNVDALIPEGQARREDLRVSDGSWTAICEVKGYTKGAKQGDISVLQGYALRYTLEFQTAPDAMWYAVNHARKSDPTARPHVLKGADDHVEAFAHERGLVLDTRELFKLRKAVGEGTIQVSAARDLLKKSTGRFAVNLDES